MDALKKKILGKINIARTRDKKYSRKCKSIRPKEVIELLINQNFECFYCDKKMLLNDHTSHKDSFTCDRIDDKQGHHRSNIVMSCLDCNKRCMNKKRLPLHELIPIV